MPDKISLWSQIQCARRELAMRRRVYPRRVAESRMTQAQADRELAEMGAIYVTLQRLELEESERREPSLELERAPISDR